MDNQRYIKLNCSLLIHLAHGAPCVSNNMTNHFLMKNVSLQYAHRCFLTFNIVSSKRGDKISLRLQTCVWSFEPVVDIRHVVIISRNIRFSYKYDFSYWMISWDCVIQNVPGIPWKTLFLLDHLWRGYNTFVQMFVTFKNNRSTRNP